MHASIRYRWARPAILLVPLLLAFGLARLPGPQVGAAFPGQNGRLTIRNWLGYYFWTINPDGSCVLGEFEGVHAAWSPDGKRIAASSSLSPSNDILVMDADGSNRVNLTSAINPDSNDQMPNWSPDGEKIVFVSYRDQNFELYMMNADGSDQIRLTNSVDWELSPVWSSDGKHIAFMSDADSENFKYDIFVMDVTGDDPPVNLTNTPNDNEADPDWSPDTNHIIFSSLSEETGFRDDLFVMDADGDNRMNLTNTPDVGEYSPVLSPDGTLIAFLAHVSDETQALFTMKPDGSNKQLMAETFATNIDDWQPLLEQETTIEIAKTVFGEPAGPWAFFMTGVAPFNLNHGQCQAFAGIPPGEYTIEEEEVPDYYQSASCSNSAMGSTAVDFEIAEGERVTCTYVNRQAPSLTISKEFRGVPTQTEWDFVGTGGIGEFTLRQSEGYSKKFEGLDPGEYTITELVPEGYVAVVQCDDFNASAGEESVTLQLEPGSGVHCAFTNKKLADVTIEKVVVGPIPEADWQFGGDLGDFTLPAAGGERTFTNLPAGDYVITETRADGYHLAVQCVENESGQAISLTTIPGGMFLEHSGMELTCTFTNSFIRFAFLPFITQ